MNITGVRDGDIVECDVRGRRFFALVTGDPQGASRGQRTLPIRPITAGTSYRVVNAPQVIGHYRRSKTSARAREEAP
jgi:hypothetical protein